MTETSRPPNVFGKIEIWGATLENMHIGSTCVSNLSTPAIRHLLSSKLTKLDNQDIRRLIIACKAELEKRESIRLTEEDVEHQLLVALLYDELGRIPGLTGHEMQSIVVGLLYSGRESVGNLVYDTSYDPVQGFVVRVISVDKEGVEQEVHYEGDVKGFVEQRHKHTDSLSSNEMD